MAIQPNPSLTGYTPRLVRKIKALTAHGLIQGPVHVGYVMDIHLLPHKGKPGLASREPDGIRSLIFADQKVIAIADFLYRGSRLTLSGIHQGDYLDPWMSAITALEKRYGKEKTTQTLSMIQFLPYPPPLLQIKSGRSITLYHFPKGKTTVITRQNLERKVTEWISSRHLQIK